MWSLNIIGTGVFVCSVTLTSVGLVIAAGHSQVPKILQKFSIVPEMPLINSISQPRVTFPVPEFEVDPDTLKDSSKTVGVPELVDTDRRRAPDQPDLALGFKKPSNAPEIPGSGSQICVISNIGYCTINSFPPANSGDTCWCPTDTGRKSGQVQ